MMHRLEISMKVHFAVLAAVGGIVLGFSESTSALGPVAILSAIFALVVVDLLQLFSLPPLAAYVGMIVVAVYCITDFIPLDSTNDRQLMAVAQLLVFIQAVLMMQRKTRRVYEQITIFYLLELVVSAVFNSAMAYGIALVVFLLLGFRAIVLLQVATVVEPALENAFEPINRETIEPQIPIRSSSRHATRAIADTGMRLPRLAMFACCPSILLIAAVLFYVLPRTAETEASGVAAHPVVGFSNTIELDQIGNLQQNSNPVMRVKLTNAADGQRYDATSPIYFRGNVLDQYDFADQMGRWRKSKAGNSSIHHRLPDEPRTSRKTDRLFYDRVLVDVTLQPQSSYTLFAIAPYYEIERKPQLSHNVGLWTLQHRIPQLNHSRFRTSYQFGTNAFSNGTQTSYIRWFGPGNDAYRTRDDSQIAKKPFDHPLLSFDSKRLPTVQAVADNIVANMNPSDRVPDKIAKRLSQFLQQESGLRYTLNLNGRRDKKLDPIEQFLKVDKKGHCQYFASTLAMMLRSQHIASRIVVGYKSGEFSTFGQHYVVRQLHAHAWVEALLQEDEIPENANLYGQSQSGPIWLRLDPTPGNDGVETVAAKPIVHSLEYLQSLWETYVVDVERFGPTQNGENRNSIEQMAGPYIRINQWLGSLVEKWQSSPFRWKAWSPLAWLLGIVGALGLLALVAYHYLRSDRLPVSQTSLGDKESPLAAAPQIPFFSETCDQLARLGFKRKPTQTPQEFTRSAVAELQHRSGDSLNKPMQILTNAYYRIRFGNAPQLPPDSKVKTALTTLRSTVDDLASTSEQSE